MYQDKPLKSGLILASTPSVLKNFKFCKQQKFTKVTSRLSPKNPQKEAFNSQKEKQTNKNHLIFAQKVFLNSVSCEYYCTYTFINLEYLFSGFQLLIFIFLRLSYFDAFKVSFIYTLVDS